MTYRERKNKQAESKGAGEQKENTPEVKKEIPASTSSTVETNVEEKKDPSIEVKKSSEEKKRKYKEGEVHTGFSVDRELLKDFGFAANLRGLKNKYLLEIFMTAVVFKPKETIEFIQKIADASEE